MPGMVFLISAWRVSGGQLFGFDFSQRCASVVRMSACSFCCSYIWWFKLFLFGLFFVGSFTFWCRGWSGILFIFSTWMRSLACLLLSSGSAPFQVWEWFLWHQGLSSSWCFELCPVYWCASWLLLPRHWPHIPEMVGLLPCRRFTESWSWHHSLFQTISSGQQASWCFLPPCSLCVALWEACVKLYPEKGGSLCLVLCFVSKLYGDFFFGSWEGDNCGLYLHFTDLKTPVICPLLFLVDSFLDSVSRGCGVFRWTPHSEIICM